jgi:hypothetical protein
MKPTLSGQQTSLGGLVEQALPFSLDPAPRKGHIILGDDGNLWHSDGSNWRLNLTAGFLDGGTVVNTTELYLETFAEADRPAAFAHPRRVIYNSDTDRPEYSDGSTWRDIADQDKFEGFIKPQEFPSEGALPPASEHTGEIAQVADAGRPSLKISDGVTWLDILDSDDKSLIVLSDLVEATIHHSNPAADFTSLKAALDWAAGFVPDLGTGRFMIQLRYLSGAIDSEQVPVFGRDLSFVLVIAEDATVTVPSTALAKSFVSGGTFAGPHHFIIVTDNGASPTFANFKYVYGGGTPPQDPDVVALVGAYTPVSHFMRLSGSAIGRITHTQVDAFGNSIASHPGGADGFDLGVYMDEAAQFTLFRSSLTNMNTSGVIVFGGVFSSWSSEITGCASVSGASVTVSGGTFVMNGESGADAEYPIDYGNDYRKTPGVDSTGTNADIIVSRGGSVHIIENGWRGGFSQPQNRQTADGVIVVETDTSWGLEGFLKPQAYSNVAALPSASLHTGEAALVLSSSVGRALVVSDGSNWKVFATEGATATD